MKRLKKYFENANVCRPNERKADIETESLFVDIKSEKPISLDQSRNIMENLTNTGYGVSEKKNGQIAKVEKNGVIIFYELGWNNFEIITPPVSLKQIDALIDINNKALEDLRLSGRFAGAKMLNSSWDGSLSNTLAIPDKRDEIWLDLDGPSLYGLGHIASIHYSIDLISIEEGMGWIKILNGYFKKTGWPPKDNFSIWKNYINGSYAKYEKNRYGQPPDNFEIYCKRLASYKVVMNRSGGALSIANPPLPFSKTKDIDIDLFLRSVWWWSRLRVRSGNLALEIRDIPRPLGTEASFWTIQNLLAPELVFSSSQKREVESVYGH